MSICIPGFYGIAASSATPEFWRELARYSRKRLLPHQSRRWWGALLSCKRQTDQVWRAGMAVIVNDITIIALSAGNFKRESMMGTAIHPPTHGHIVRRLSDRSFTTDNPEACSQWLRSIGYVDQPTRGTEYARLQLDAGVCIIYPSGLLVICLGGGQV